MISTTGSEAYKLKRVYLGLWSMSWKLKTEGLGVRPSCDEAAGKKETENKEG